jgi:endoglucanase
MRLRNDRLPAGLAVGSRRLRALTAALVAVTLICVLPEGGGAETIRSSLNPFRGARLYVNPGSPARRQAEAWRRTRPRDAAEMDKIAAQSHAAWFGDWNDDVRADVAAEISAAARTHAVPVLVAYHVPHRDCGGQSAGGARSARAYRRWIGQFAAGLGAVRAAVVLEPDALPGLDCLARSDRRKRLRLISSAVNTLRSHPNIAIYLDAGHSGWQPPRVIASRLLAAGVARARGFSLNVSNFNPTRREVAYGARISARTRGKPFVIDTSRNGAGPADDRQWCNPPGRALGRRPSTRTGRRLVDAYLWIKTPGESDGRCNGGPAAGAWWPEYALGLARRAAW